MLKNLKGSPLSVFRHCETLARQGLALAGPGAPLGPFFWVCNFFGKFFFQKISIFEYCKRVLDTGKSFCYFWALDMAPTWAGPGLLYNTCARQKQGSTSDKKISANLTSVAKQASQTSLFIARFIPKVYFGSRCHSCMSHVDVKTPEKRLDRGVPVVYREKSTPSVIKETGWLAKTHLFEQQLLFVQQHLSRFRKYLVDETKLWVDDGNQDVNVHSRLSRRSNYGPGRM